MIPFMSAMQAVTFMQAKRLAIIVFYYLLSVGVYLAMAGGAASAAASLQSGLIRVADDQAYPPYIFINAAGQPDGFEVDLFRLIEQDTGLKFEWTLTEFGKAVEMLRAGQVDMIPGMNVTEMRKGEFAFSKPYLQDKGVLFVPSDSYHISRLEDLVGRRVGVQQGEVAEQFARQSKNQLPLYFFSSQRELMQAVADRRIDAAISNYYAGHYYLYQLKLEEKVKAIGDELFSHPFAVAAGKGDTAAIARIDAALGKLQSGGQIEALREKWFGRQNLILGLSREKVASYGKMAALSLVFIAGAVLGIIVFLRRRIARATKEIAGQRDELFKAYQEMAAQNEELQAQDELLGYQNRRLQQQETKLTNRNQMLEALQDTTVEMLLINEVDELFSRILKRAAQLAGTDSAKIDTWDAVGKTFQSRMAMGYAREIDHAPDKGLAGVVIRTGRTLLIDDYQTWEGRLREPELDKIRSVLGVPLLINAEVRGLIVMDHTIEGKTFTPEQVAAVEQFARIASIVLANADAREALQTMAYQDTLTGMPNRFSFMENLKHELVRSARGETTGTIMLLDLDNFKMINDSLGHACGDLLLKEVSRRLLEISAGAGMVARIGGDEFIVLLADMTQTEVIEEYAARIMQSLTHPFEVCGQRMFCTVSIGIVRYPEDGAVAEELFRDADTVLHAVKSAGKNTWRFFDSAMRESVYRRMQLEHSLHQAMGKEELFVVYQPVVELLTRRIVGFEALLRWNSPEHGDISPLTFIPIAEETGWIVSIGQWVMSQACDFAQRLRRDGYEGLFVAVNLSPRQLVQSNFVAMVRSILQDKAMPPELLELEITENVFMESVELNLQKIRELSRMGIKLALDDFGTGYSSLTYLKNLPISKVKFDKTFVDDIGGSAINSTILGSIVQLAHGIGLTVVAEGVETEAQQSELIRQGCDLMQGYLFSKPVSEAEIDQLLSQKR